MKQLAANYSISGSTVTLAGVNVPLSQILLVSNATTGSVLYSVAGPAPSSYTQATNSTITLASAPGASDNLTIYYDDGVAPTNAPSSVSVSNFPSTPQLGSGVVTATTQRVTLASDDPEVTNSTAIKDSVATIATESHAIDAKLPALSNGRVPVDANSVPSTTFTYTNTGAIPINTVLIGPIDCSQFKEICVHAVTLTSGTISVQVSNDGTNFVQTLVTVNTGGGVFGSAFQATNQIVNYSTLGAKFARVYAQSALGAGTTNIVAVFNQIPTTKTYVDAAVRGVLNVNPSIGSANWGPTSMLSVVSTASTNATNIKASAAQVFTLVASNTSLEFKFLKIFNKASAPTLGTDTPVLNIAIPPNSSVDVGTNTFALRLVLGLSYAITGGSALLDNTAVGAGDVCFSIVHS
jgi:hypothetical protein